MRLSGPLWLASRSPRRRQLLMEADIPARVMPPDIDDAALRPGSVSPQQWVMALAYFKARRVDEILVNSGAMTWPSNLKGSRSLAGSGALVGAILGADTVCVIGNEILGQPGDADDARRMLKLLRNAEHQTITGVCLLSSSTLPGRRGERSRLMFFDAAAVRLGDVTDHQIEAYVASGDWRGKAGAYNLIERIQAGWPIECGGDPTTVMGLPMQRLKRILD